MRQLAASRCGGRRFTEFAGASARVPASKIFWTWANDNRREKLNSDLQKFTFRRKLWKA